MISSCSSSTDIPISLLFSDQDLEPLPIHEATRWSTSNSDGLIDPLFIGSSVSPLVNKGEAHNTSLFGSIYSPLSLAFILNDCAQKKPLAYVPGPTKIDVVCSRGRCFSELPGSLRFRKIVQEYLPSYISASTRVDKTSIIAEIIDHVLNHDEGNVRFLKYHGSTKSWSVMGRDQIRDKVGHALREKIEEMNCAKRLATSR